MPCSVMNGALLGVMGEPTGGEAEGELAKEEVEKGVLVLGEEAKL